MVRWSWTKRLLLAAAVLLPAGCIELTGQRISWFYDQQADQMQILVHYDGIHDTGQGNRGDEQIPRFVEGGDMMFVDWFLHFDMASLRRQIDDPNVSPLAKDWARLITSVRTEPAGYYVEPDGRVGAAQLITIPKATEFVKKLNGLVSRQILTIERTGDAPTDDTLARIQAAAKTDHQWLALSGQSIRVVVPVEPNEWMRLRGVAIRMSSEWITRMNDPADPEIARRGKALLMILSSIPWSYVDQGDRVTFVLGRASRTSWNLRLPIRDEYRPGMEKVVADSVKTDLDQALARLLLDKEAPRSGPVAAVLEFGPPEDAVRALLTAAGSADAAKQRAAVERLKQWAAEWNQARRLPEAPAATDSPQDYLAAWKQWYAQMKQFPVYGE